jgi:hypothetical protein
MGRAKGLRARCADLRGAEIGVNLADAFAASGAERVGTGPDRVAICFVDAPDMPTTRIAPKAGCDLVTAWASRWAAACAETVLCRLLFDRPMLVSGVLQDFRIPERVERGSLWVA